MSTDTPRLQQHQPHDMGLAQGRQTVTESPRQTPVVAEVDVLVVGGGPAGVGAALAAAREGAKTLLIERHGMLGGMWTAGLVNPFFEFHKKGWLVAELVQRLTAEAAWRPHPSRSTFDTETMVRLLETMLTEAKADFWYHAQVADTIVEDNQVRGVLVESKAGREAVLAEVTVDCTGDGDVAARAGVPYELGRMSDGLLQPMTLMFEIDGLGGYEQGTTEETYDQLVEAITSAKLGFELPFGCVNYTPAIITLPRDGSAIVQATHVYRLNGLDPREVTQGIVAARQQAYDLTTAIQHLPGLENVRLLRTASTLGIRETRRLRGQYRLDMDDLTAGRHFEDAITFCAFGVDIHEPAPGAGLPSGHHAPMRAYEIPYRCLLPETVGGLLFAGRCISGSHEAHASYRVTGTCLAMGQAAGLAAAWAAREHLSPAMVPGNELRQALEARGAGLL